jgi:hypothetical protein
MGSPLFHKANHRQMLRAWKSSRKQLNFFVFEKFECRADKGGSGNHHALLRWTEAPFGMSERLSRISSYVTETSRWGDGNLRACDESRTLPGRSIREVLFFFIFFLVATELSKHKVYSIHSYFVGFVTENRVD